MPVYLVIDNGSKKPEATIRLRELAAKLSEVVTKTVYAVSLQHADSIDTCELNNIPANTFYSFLQQQLKQGKREFVVLPLFFGMSRALSSFIPEQVKLLKKEFGSFNIKITMAGTPIENNKIVVVDHGSPVPEITEVRKRAAVKLNTLLGEDVIVDQAVMERRAGREYDFNGDLLEDYLKQQAIKGNNNIIVAMLFFLPGRHAGECGDIEEICNQVINNFPDLQVVITPLISEHELLLEILHARLLEAE